MDTSDYPGEPDPNAIARAMEPAIAAAREALRGVDFSSALGGLTEINRGLDAALAPAMTQLNGLMGPLQSQLAGLPRLSSGLDSVIPDIGLVAGLDDAWLSRIADSTGLSVDLSIHQDLIDAVNQALAAVDEVGLLDDPADVQDEAEGVRAAVDEVDLGELGEAGRAFVAQEGRGLSWEAKKRLFLLFVGATLLLALVQAMVVNEAAKELLEDGSTALAYVVPALAAASVGWDRVMPRPEDPDENPDTES
ncbi:hypothetical protein [Streptomyces sp. NPDC059783]|uniref:hypothetical protein n=1 Tax=Streptomyces sp. NPDC059783 TaxID=3346944 RepID=UPI00364FF03D